MLIFLKDFSLSFEVPDRIAGLSGKKYELGERIGGGGNGAVYECLDQAGNVLAVKFLLRLNKKSEARFKQEIRILKEVETSHIIKYIDDGAVEGTQYRQNRATGNTTEIPFVIMEKAECNLAEYLAKDSDSVPYEVYASQFRGLCEALAELHKHAVHRDIKPENILIKGDKWILSDFGLCQALLPEEQIDVTDDGEKLGPAFWMTPEAMDNIYFKKDNIGTYSDVFQMGAVFAFVLTRHHPGGIIHQDNQLNTTPEISMLIKQALSNDFNLRPQNGGELLRCYNVATIGE
jgi:serine/threonine-protein kinase